MISDKRFIAIFFILLPFFPLISQDNAVLPVKKILILHGDEQFSMAKKTMDRTFDEVFSKAKTFRSAIYSENIEAVRFKTKNQERINFEFLKERYSQMKLDLIMVTDIFALRFMLSKGKEIFHDTPVVFCGISEGSIDDKNLPANFTGNYKGISIRESVNIILKIHSNVSEIVFIVGVDQQDEEYKKMALNAEYEFRDRVRFSIIQDYSLEEMKTIISRMPSHTAAIYLAIHQDNSGLRIYSHDALCQLSKISNIPIYGIADITLDYGIVGGNLFGFNDLSYNSAMIGMDVLNGKKPSDISIQISKNRNYFNWNEMYRWNIKESDLPKGSIIIDRPPDPLALYWRQIIIAIIFFIILLILIIVLVVQLRFKQKTGKNLYHLNRKLHTISECNQAMLRANNEKDLLTEICKIICEKGGYLMAWVGYAQHDEKKSVLPICRGGIESNYLDDIDIRWSETETGISPTGTCIRTNKICYIQDLAAYAAGNSLFEEAVKHGYHSCIALPLVDKNKSAFGSLTIYSSKPDAFVSEEISLLEELSWDLSYGVNYLRIQNEQKIAEEQIRRSLDEKETLLRELYHRTKNNMQVISSLLNLQLEYNPDDIIKDVFNAIKNRIQSMSLVQQKLYLSNDLSSIDLKEYIIDLSKLLADSYNIKKDRIDLDLSHGKYFRTH